MSYKYCVKLYINRFHYLIIEKMFNKATLTVKQSKKTFKSQIKIFYLAVTPQKYVI